MNVKKRHEHRRLQTPAHSCWCPIHKGGPAPKRYGHTIGEETIAMWRQVGGYIETGPWFDNDGNVVDPSIDRSEYVHWDGPPRRIRVTKTIRSLRARSRRAKVLARQAARNPNYPSREYIVALAGWHARGAIITPDGPVFRARLA